MERYRPKPYYLTVDDLAERYGVHRITIYNWRRKGVIPRGELIAPGTRRWRRVDIEAFDAERAARAKG